MRRAVLAVAVTAGLGLASIARAQEGAKEGEPPPSTEERHPAVGVRALRVEEPPELDGRLDEPAWSLAEAASGLRAPTRSCRA